MNPTQLLWKKKKNRNSFNNCFVCNRALRKQVLKKIFRGFRHAHAFKRINMKIIWSMNKIIIATTKFHSTYTISLLYSCITVFIENIQRILLFSIVYYIIFKNYFWSSHYDYRILVFRLTFWFLNYTRFLLSWSTWDVPNGIFLLKLKCLKKKKKIL